MRRVHAAREYAARLHHLPAGVVHGRTGMVAGPYERELVRNLRVHREDFGDLDSGRLRADRFEWPANLGRCIRLHVEGIKMARPAKLVEEENRLGLGGDSLPRDGFLDSFGAKETPRNRR